MENINYTQIQSWPKIELHIHLDTSLLFETVDKLVNGISEFTYKKYFIAPDKCRDLHHFLSFVEPSISLLQDKKSIEMAFDHLVASQQKENVIYSEIRFAPFLHTRAKLHVKEVVEIACVTAEKASGRYGLPVNLILCTMRHFTSSQSIETAQMAAEYKNNGIVGFDLAGDEAGFSLNSHKEAFRIAKSLGVLTTAHAGEALGHQSVEESLSELQPLRIGHGVRSIESLKTIQRLSDNKTHLEICPTSNIQIEVFDNMSIHSIDQLYKYGINLGINTDGRGLFNTTLTDEYIKIAKAFNWTSEDFFKSNTFAAKSAFCSSDLKTQLVNELESFSNNY